ncbi:hypothetical protein FQA39_LY11045 [Lamprigera yunnana]|nr:hypothetical protein FQA39_LY11045 [Lamprigera yunnana]
MKFLILLLLIGYVTSTPVRYDNYTVYRVIPRNIRQLNLLRKYEETNVFDFWSDVTRINANIDIMVGPKELRHFEKLTNVVNLESRVMIPNVQDLINHEQKREPTSHRFNWKEYHRLDNINAWLDSLEAQHPDKVKVIIGGKSYENREIRGVYVNFNSNNKAIFLEGGIHAREWIAPATVTFILNELLTNTDPEVRKIVESRNWYLFPSVNPDGYEYAHVTDRMWRKTRKPYGVCVGADPNRNWGYKWNHGGASSNPCSETYAGDKPFSEIETQTLSEYLNQIITELDIYLSIHSYSQLLMTPFGHEGFEKPENHEQMIRIATEAAKKLKERYGTEYEVGNVAEILYITSGGSRDWMAGVHRVKLVYTYELRDTGKYGFILPQEQIIPTGLETFDSILELIRIYDAEQ